MNEKKYRPNVAAVVLSPSYPEKCEIFIACRNDIKDAWQFPQGGIDEGEHTKEALKRELMEEINTNDIEIVAEYPEWVCYDFPETIAKKMYPFDGQKQRYFLVRLKSVKHLSLNTEEPEFCEYKFIKYDEIYNYITYFKRNVYKQVLSYFKKEGYL